ncbi:MAG: hypothetical protein VW270_29865, partial [Candidatus Poseidoniales archaeon]
MSILAKLKSNTTIKESDILADSKFFTKKDMIPTEIPVVNLALSGRLDGGLTPGLTMWAGPSKHFKTAFSLLMAKAYLDKYDDGIAILYDSEYGATPDYLESYDIDTSRVLHVPIEDVEQLKFDMTKRLDELEKGDRVFILIDSIGNLSSKKEVEYAKNEKSV